MTTTSRGAALLAAVGLMAAPAPAFADESNETGDLTVTRFDDRYADGLFDPSKTSPSGDRDRLNTDLAAQLVDVNGTRHYKSADADGLYRFTDVPVGPATLYLGHPNDPAGEVFFDATGATSAQDITRLPTTQYFGAQGTAKVDIDADGEERLIGMTALRLVADVENADGSPVAGLTSVELGSGDDWYSATEYGFQPGTYEAFEGYGYVRHLPGDLGVRITPPAGYRVKSVTAGDADDYTVTQRGGAYYFDSVQVPTYFWNPAFTITLEEEPDTRRPEVSLVSPVGTKPVRAIDVQVDATDDRGLRRVVANIYSGSTLVKSTQTAANGATAATHRATVNLPDGTYTVRYNAQDAAGNISRTSTQTVVVDTTAPTPTVKSGSAYTVGDAATGYSLISFKLYDAQKIDKVVINGTTKDLTDNAWSDVNFVKPGVFGAVQGANTLVVHDVAGNTKTVEFTLR